MKIALIGKRAVGKTFVAFTLERKHNFKRIRMDDGITKFVRDMYGYGEGELKHARPKWELRLDIYDALYKIDPQMHTRYLFRKMQRISKDIVIENVRYISELQTLRDAGFIIVRIASPEIQRKRHIAKSLRNAEKGTLLLAEHFYDDRTASYNADYVLLNEDRERTRQAIKEMLDTIRSKNV